MPKGLPSRSQPTEFGEAASGLHSATISSNQNSGSYAGALLDILAHARRLDLKVDYRCVVIDIPKRVPILKVNPGRVRGWDAVDYVAGRTVGDRWLEKGESAILCVPSMTGRPHELNYIINPEHPDARRLTVHTPHAVIWDDRLG